MLSWGLVPLLIIFFGGLTSLYYCYTNIRNLIAWKSIPIFSDTNINQDLFFSILVPARNESKNIIECISSILAQNFPTFQFEIIFINDHSSDNTLELVRQNFQDKIKIVNLEDESAFGKKNAIKRGIEVSKGNWIVTTDADCRVGKNWLHQFANCIQQTDTVFCCSPVMFSTSENSLEIFQQLDIIGMMGATAGGIQRKSAFLANGANLAYKKSVFYEVNGFRGIDRKASGDDMLLLQKVVKKYPDQIAFVKSFESLVITPPESNLNGFLNQRLRWASKGDGFPNIATWLQMIFIFLFCFFLMLSLVLTPLQPFIYIKLFLGLYCIKFVSDYFYLKQLSKFFDQENLSKHIWWATLAHALYVVTIGIWAQFYKSYEWKGRRTK